jgi:hypothetical protein
MLSPMLYFQFLVLPATIWLFFTHTIHEPLNTPYTCHILHGVFAVCTLPSTNLGLGAEAALGRRA